MLILRQFLLLVWKGAVLRKRHFIVTLFEVAVPLFLICMIVYMKTLLAIPTTETDQRKPATIYDAFNPLDIERYSSRYLFIYTPDDTQAELVINKVMEKMTRNESNSIFSRSSRILAAPSEDSMLDIAISMQQNYTYNQVFGIVLENLPNKDGTPLKQLKYKIRTTANLNTEDKYPMISFAGPASEDSFLDTSSYVGSKFLLLQAAIDHVFLELSLPQDKKDVLSKTHVWMNRFPYPPYFDLTLSMLQFFLIPIFLQLGFSIMMTVFVKRIVDEKANRAKEMMRMMGMNDMVYFGGTFFNTFLVIFFIMTVAIILFKIPMKNGVAVFDHSEGFLVYIILLLYAVNSLLFCMAISTFFNRAVIAAIVTYMLWQITYSLPVFLMDPPFSGKYIGYSGGAKLATCLLPNAALHWACKLISFNEGAGFGSDWKNMSEPFLGDNICLAEVMGMMVASSVFYVFLIWYVDNVWPWQFGIPKHPFYFFMPSYWCPRKSNVKAEIDFDDETADKSYFEEEPTDRRPGISVSGLTKAFGWGSSRKVAVNNFSLNMYHGQITALLGHNGAGKTTTMNVITGLFPPTKGTAVVNGYSVLDQLKMARQSLGLCPQHNVLYDNLTVEEHLTFFAGIKGRGFAEMKPEINSCLALLDLQNKRNDLARTLSGGMKRKLSLGLAMIGGSEVLVLDEPTSGMDPQARRVIWDLLQQIREERTIVLTTHYMEEADILGDRIAIMAEGTLQCCGSPLFLKRKFGAGYHLRVAKGDTFKQSKMTEAVQGSVPSAYVESDMRTEISYVLPVTTSESFVSMFEHIESEKKNIGYLSCGLSITTMEDVFLKVGKLAEKAEDTEQRRDSTSDYQVTRDTLLTGCTLYLHQVRALLLKRFHDSRRYIAFLIFLIVLPILVIILMMVAKNAAISQSQDIKPLKLDLKEVFGDTIGYYSFNHNTDIGNKFTNEMVKGLKEAGATPTESKNVAKDVLEVGTESLQKYRNKLLVGGSISETATGEINATAWYSGEAYHTSAMSLNLMNTALWRTLLEDPSFTISVINAPFPDSNRDGSQSDVSNVLMLGRLIISFFLPLANAFLSASFVLFPIHERQTKSKLIQLMTGVDGLTFWITHFIWDFGMYLISACVMLIPFVAMDVRHAFDAGTGALGVQFLLMVLYGWSSIPLAYLMSFISNKPSTGFIIVSAINFIAGLILTVIVTVMKIGEMISLTLQQSNPGDEKSDQLAYAFRLLPNFALTWGSGSLDMMAGYNVLCDNANPAALARVCERGLHSSSLFRCCKVECVAAGVCFEKKSLLSMEPDGCGRDMIFMLLTGLFFFTLLVLLETNLVRFWYRARDSGKNGAVQQMPPTMNVNMQVMQPLIPSEDSDVAAERTHIEYLFQEGLTTQEALVAHNLSKTFGNITAVDHVTFSVHQNECFGLLGVNGAGKTTTFSMLTGDLYIGEGTAQIGLHSVRDDLKQFQRQVGYCPQFDALLDRLTGREALYLFARLRGVPESEIPGTVKKLINIVDLQAHADKTADKYSGGNRRKLSLALALVGNPPVIFLDEPTAGVDPASRRKIWNAFTSVQAAGGTSFILTTHSMEECEALCGRLVIMVNGTFRCLGAIQHLKSKFGQGYTIIVKLNKDHHMNQEVTEAVKYFFHQVFPGSTLKDIHQGMLHYHIADTRFTWSYMFREMEKAKHHFTLEDYLISDTTLEQIFLAFARAQRVVASP